MPDVDTQEKEQALRTLTRYVQPNVEPRIEPEELKEILENNRRARTWTANTALKLNEIVVPTTGNGRQYKVINAGTTGATEPTGWPLLSPDYPLTEARRITSGTALLEDDGPVKRMYDVRAAAYEAWNLRVTKASQYVSTPGVNMSLMYDHAVQQRDRFQPLAIG
jgi:hypothetical protein